MAGEVDICNLALGRIKQGTISDLDPDESAEAEACARLYPLARDYVLADYPWRMNTYIQSLTELDNDRPDDWGYRYQRPTCLRIRHLLNENGRHDPKCPVRFQQTATGIYTDAEAARAQIQTKETDTTLYSPGIVSLIAWRLAYELVGPLEAGEGLMQWANRKYIAEKAEVQATDASEELVEEYPANQLPGPLAARE